MAAAVTSNLTIIPLGAPLAETLVLSGARQEWALTLSGVANAIVQFTADAGAGAFVAYGYASAGSGGVVGLVPTGGSILLPISGPSQSWFFIQDASAAAAVLRAIRVR